MLNRELLRQIGRLEIRTRRMVNDIFSGQYKSVFRGLGMEFSEVREYVPGDDVRAIDWNVTARMGHPYIKKFISEREMTVMLMVDASASLRFGTASRWKSELAAEVAAVLAFSAIRNNDKVGLCLFSDHVEKFIRPRKGRLHTLRLIREVLTYEPQRIETRMEDALRYLNRVMRRRAVVFIFSDFYSADERLLAVTNKRHDLVALQVRDPMEERLPRAGIIELSDAETGERVTLDASDGGLRRAFQEKALARQKTIEQIFRRHSIDFITLETGQSFVQPLVKFFQSRVKRFR